MKSFCQPSLEKKMGGKKQSADLIGALLFEKK